VRHINIEEYQQEDKVVPSERYVNKHKNLGYIPSTVPSHKRKSIRASKKLY
jgi:hypothetical protein